MRASLVLLASVAVLAAPKWFQLEGYTFDTYVKQFGRTYSAEELPLRRELFSRRLAEIRRHNAGNSSYKKGVNQFTDQTDAERAAVMGYNGAYGVQRRFHGLGHAVPFQSLHVPELNNAPHPEIKDASYFSWIRMGYLGGVPDQGGCGSCWAFAAKVALESRYAIASGHRAVPTLSPEQLASCAPNPGHCGGAGGCEGSTPELAYDYIHDVGALGEEFVYPYRSYTGAPANKTCPTKPSGVGVAGYTRVPSNDLQATLRALTTGPLAVAVFAGPWHDYESGIFDGCQTAGATNMDLNHAVVLTGIGIEGDKGFWEIRNSWGPAWGEGGTIRLARDNEPQCYRDTTPTNGVECLDPPAPPVVTVCGECGILYDPVFPILPKRV